MNNEYFSNFKPNYDDKILKKHNMKVYDKIIKGFTKGNKVLFEQATGTGKSYLAIKFLKDHAKGKKVLFVSPSDSIDMYFVDTILKTLLYFNDDDLAVLNKKEKLAVIKKYLNIDFNTCLYQGLKGVKEKQYDIIIFDEAHRMGAEKWGQNSEALLKNNPDAKVIGMTATMERTDGVNVKKFFDNKAPVSRMTLVDALKKGILPSFEYKLGKINFEEESKYVEENTRSLTEKLKTAEGEERKEILELLDKLKQAKKFISESKEISTIFQENFNTEKLKKGKFIVFCPPGQDMDEDSESVHKMQKMMEQAPGWFSQVAGLKGVKAYSVYANDGAVKNRQTIKEFEEDDSDSIKLLFSINMLNEGLHVDDIDGVIMLRSTNSRIVYLQQLGRALSVGNNTKPLIFDFVANLSAVDINEISEVAKAVNNPTAPTGSLEDDFERVYEKPEHDIFSLEIENLNEIQFIENLKSNIYAFNHKFDFEFEDFYRRLVKYKEKHGNCNVPFNYKCKEDKYPLGQKVKSIRQGINQHLKGIKTSPEQRKRLNDLGFVWDATVRFDFEDFYKRLIEYKSEFGDCKVPVFYMCSDGYKLGFKVQGIRGEDIKLSKEQKEQLNDLGFVWKVGVDFNFVEFCDRLKKYHNEFGDYLVPYNYVCKDGYKLGKKVSSIRSGNIKSSEEQKEQLNAIGFVWKVQLFDFEDFYNRLKKYKNEFGDCLVPVSYKCDDGYKLGQKVKSMRRGLINLTQEQKEQLNAIGFVWDATRKFDFEDFYNRLKKYKDEFGDCLVSGSYKCDDGYKLGQRVSSVRMGEIKLSQEQKEQLNAIGFVWDATVRFDFEDFYNRLKKYKNEFGDCLVPVSYKCDDGYKLGKKITYIRVGDIKLTEEQKEQLNDLGFIWKVRNIKSASPETGDSDEPENEG